jgi:hypothetical protein
VTSYTDYGIYQVKDDEPEDCIYDYCSFCTPIPHFWERFEAARTVEQDAYGWTYDPNLAAERPHP